MDGGIKEAESLSPAVGDGRRDQDRVADHGPYHRPVPSSPMGGATSTTVAAPEPPNTNSGKEAMGKLDTICGQKLTQIFNKGGSVAKAPVAAGCALQTENISVRVVMYSNVM